MCLSDVRHIIVSPNIKRSLSMFKKFLIIQSVIIILFLNMTSSFIYAGFFSDNIETHTVPAPTVPSDGNLLSNDELVTDFNEEYYNDNHLVEDETEAGETFDEKAEFHTTEDLSGLPNSSKSTKDELRSQQSNYSNSTKVTEIFQQLAENGIMTIAADDDDYPVLGDIFLNSSWFSIEFASKNYAQPSARSPLPNIYSASDYLEIFKTAYSSYYDISTKYYGADISRLIDDKDCNILNIDDMFVFSLPTNDGDNYTGVIFSDSDVYATAGGSFSISNDNFLLFTFGIFRGKTYGVKYQFYTFSSLVSHSQNYSFGTYSSTGFIYDDIKILFSGGHNFYLNDVKQDVVEDSGVIKSSIYGDFGFKEDSKILTYKAWSDKELDKTYDVHLWAMDCPSVPSKINGNEDFPIRDLDNYTSHGLQLSFDKSSVQASYELESVYYYLHHMKGYDDSLESVDGYGFDEFESRENINFAIAYRENGSAGDWIVCKSYQYNYGDLIDNVMGSFTVKKDYVDFPDMSDYIEDYESWDDVAADCADENGEYNIIEVGFKWIGRNVMHFAHNFVGFFQWLFDCVPILWENLTIELYNLVCDLKELALYFVNPKTKSIYAMTCERIPSFSLLVDSFKNNNSSTLPSFTFFGTKFSLNFRDYDIDFSFIRNISTILFYLLFGCFVFKLIFKIFGFGSSGGDED